MFSLHCCLSFNFGLSTSNYPYPILLNSLLFCHFTLWHVTFGSLLLFCHLYFKLCHPIIIYSLRLNQVLGHWLTAPSLLIHCFLLICTQCYKLSKHISSTLLVPGINSWHLRSLGLKECCWAGSGPQYLALCPPLLMEVTRDTPLQELRIFCFIGVRGAPHTLFVHMYRKISKSSEVHHTSFCHYLCQ